MNFGEKLKLLRKEKGLRQENLADELELKRPTISGYETGRKEPDFHTLIKISQYFNVSVDYLIGKSDFKVDFVELRKVIEENPELGNFFTLLVESEDLQLLVSSISKMDDELIKKLGKVLEIVV